MTDCFLARGNAHCNSRNYAIALVDIERALMFDPFFLPALESKITLLRKLKRSTEAYHLLKTCLTDKRIKLNSSSNGLWKTFKKNLVQIKNELKLSYIYSTTTDDVTQLDISDSDSVFLKVDSRIKWSVNKLTKRLCLRTNDAIVESGVTVLTEKPIQLVIRSAARHTHCAGCGRECENTFWPCSQCTEVIFCSNQCSKQANAYHHLECGIIGLLNQEQCHFRDKQSPQVYRHLVTMRHEQLIKLDSDVMSKKRLSETQSNLKMMTLTMTKAQAKAWFAVSSSEFRRFLLCKQPFVPMNKLAHAIYLASIYWYQTKMTTMDQQIFAQLIRCLAIEYTKAELNEYCYRMWIKDSNNPELPSSEINVSYFQCLFGSRIGHSCEPNCEWRFDGSQFSLMNIR